MSKITGVSVTVNGSVDLITGEFRPSNQHEFLRAVTGLVAGGNGIVSDYRFGGGEAVFGFTFASKAVEQKARAGQLTYGNKEVVFGIQPLLTASAYATLATKLEGGLKALLERWLAQQPRDKIKGPLEGGVRNPNRDLGGMGL